MRHISITHVLATGVASLALVCGAASCKQQNNTAPAPTPAPAAATPDAAHTAPAAPPADGTAAAAHATAPGTATAPTAPPAPPPSASPPDPHDAPLGQFVHSIAEAMMHAANGEPVDARFVAHPPAESVATLTDEARRALGVLGHPVTMSLAEMELDIVAQPNAGEHHHVMAHVIMLPDGTIRWGTVAGRQDESALVEPTPGLDHSAPVVVAAATRLADALRTNCSLPWLAPSDVSSLPEAIRGEFVADLNATHAACSQVQAVHGEWRAHVDDVRVVVQGSGHVGYLNSVFDVEGANTPAPRLVLGQLHIELVPEAH